MASAVKHLHAFAREVNLTPAEWIRGIGFMTEVGKMCTPARQEFILLSDVLGSSMQTVTVNDHTRGDATRGAGSLAVEALRRAQALAAAQPAANIDALLGLTPSGGESVPA